VINEKAFSTIILDILVYYLFGHELIIVWDMFPFSFFTLFMEIIQFLYKGKVVVDYKRSRGCEGMPQTSKVIIVKECIQLDS